MAEKRLAIIDGTYYTFRAFYGLKSNLTNKDGQPTGAVYAFKQMIITLLKELQPEYVAIVFDAGGKSFRDDIYDKYKANRDAPPDALISQFPLIEELVEKIGFKLVSIEGVEADDVIGTLAKKFKNETEVYIVSADKDLTQMVDEKILMFDSLNSKTYDITEVKNKHGVDPKQIPDYLAIVGDVADNIPGVMGLGAKGAAKLLNEYGSLKNIKEKINELAEKDRAKLQASWENLLLSEKLTTINSDIEIDFSLNDLIPQKPDQNILWSFYNKLNFRPDQFLNTNSLIDLNVKTEPVETNKKSTIDTSKFELISDIDKFEKYIDQATKNKILTLDIETTALEIFDAEIVGISVKTEGLNASYLACAHQEAKPQVDLQAALKILKKYFSNPELTLVGQNLKYEASIFKKYGLEIENKLEDTLIMSYLLQLGLRSYSLDALAEHFFNHNTIKIEELIGKGKTQITFDKVPIDKATIYSAEDCEVTWSAYKILKPKIAERELGVVYSEIDVPCLVVLAEMEFNGVKIDKDYFAQYQKKLSLEVEEIDKEVQKISPEPFNIASPKQLSDILFNKMGITEQRQKTKTGFSTDQSVLEKLAPKYKIAELVLNYRLKQKLLNTYLEVLPKLIHPKTGRIHTDYNQAVALTGRISSSNPNLQNIPIRGNERSLIRKGFTADDGNILISADYSQIELRVLAHLCEDPGLIAAFKDDFDIHEATAKKVFKQDKISSEQRAIAKAINFGLVYGMGAHSLALVTNSSFSDAKKYIEDYFTSYPNIQGYMRETVEFAHKNQYVKTAFGRRRYLNKINSKNAIERSAEERVAMNSPIQGTAADIIKLAMIKLKKILDQNAKEFKMKPKIIMQVHDELVVEASEQDKVLATKLLKEAMEDATKLIVPLKVNISAAKTWDEAG